MTVTETSKVGVEPPEAQRGPRRTSILNMVLDNIVWLLLIVFALGANFLNSFFLTVPNLQNILVQATSLGFVALAVALTLLIGEIDLSVVGILGFSGAIGALLVQRGVPGGLAILAVLATGAVIGLINGICIAKFRMNSLIETLAMGLTLGGGVLAITEGRTITITSDAYLWIGQGRIGDWPVMPIALLVIFVIMAIALTRTPWGRRLYATGGNPRAAFSSGIAVDRVRIQTYVVSGLLAGAAGWLATAYLAGVNSTVGSNLLLYAIAAPVIGGVSLFGGRGRVLGMLGGILLLTVVQVGLQIVNISAYYVAMVGGAMIFLAVFVDALRVRRREA
jgi:simple sugar transport system permease protein/ribose transport system permease protein